MTSRRITRSCTMMVRGRGRGRSKGRARARARVRARVRVSYYYYYHLHDGGPDGDGAQGRPHVAAQEGVVADAHGGVRGEVRIRVRVES